VQAPGGFAGAILAVLSTSIIAIVLGAVEETQSVADTPEVRAVSLR
jgi:hypothetical protein